MAGYDYILKNQEWDTLDMDDRSEEPCYNKMHYY